MADVLACVPKRGLDAVLVAVELILEAGHASPEHVKNVLSRLEEGPPPIPIETPLALVEPPVADTARYDGLVAGVPHEA